MTYNYNFFDELEKFGDAPAVETECKIISYSQLVNMAENLTRDIFSRALVFLVCKNEPEAIAGYIGCIRKRAVPVLINSTIDKDLFNSLKNLYRPNYILCPENFNDGEYKLSLENKSPHEIFNDLAILLTTSGSTGSPKFVRQSYKNIQANTHSICEYLKISRNDKAITTMPMSYTYGLSIIQTHLFSGATIFTTEKNFFNRDFWQIMRDKKINTFGAVPYTYEMLDKLRFLKMNLPDLKYITQAGGHLNKDLQNKFARGFHEQNKKFIVMYGAAEATARMSYIPSEYALNKIGSIGIAIPGGRFEIIDDDQNIITAPNLSGELVYYGDNVTLGYAQCLEDLAKNDENKGRLLTGDIAKFDEDGFFYIEGRKKRFLKIFGNRVNLAELEEILKARGYECACTGVDDHLKIYMTDKTKLTTVIETAESVTHLNRAAFEAVYIEKIPRNDAGKILYSELV